MLCDFCYVLWCWKGGIIPFKFGIFCYDRGNFLTTVYFSNLNKVILVCINSIYVLYYIILSTQLKSQSCEKPFTPAGSESYTGMEAHPLMQKKPATVSRRKLTKTRRKAITETKLQADPPLPQPHPPETKKREDGKTTTDVTRTTSTTNPRNSTHVTPIYTYIQ